MLGRENGTHRIRHARFSVNGDISGCHTLPVQLASTPRRGLMRPTISVSTRFITTMNAHQVWLLVTVGADAPVTRPPITVALVLDR